MAPQYNPNRFQQARDYFAGFFSQNADNIVDRLKGQDIYKEASQLGTNPIGDLIWGNSEAEFNRALEARRKEAALAELYTSPYRPYLDELGITHQEAAANPQAAMKKVLEKKKAPGAEVQEAIATSQDARRLAQQTRLDNLRQRRAELEAEIAADRLKYQTEGSRIKADQAIAEIGATSSLDQAKMEAMMQKAIAEGRNAAAQTYADRQNAADAAYHQREIDAYNKEDIADTIIEGLRIFGDAFGY
tara:strand:+ start:116 stop:853 length:738 start_codon:yes stop_codon:yes gene_type:complete